MNIHYDKQCNVMKLAKELYAKEVSKVICIKSNNGTDVLFHDDVTTKEIQIVAEAVRVHSLE